MTDEASIALARIWVTIWYPPGTQLWTKGVFPRGPTLAKASLVHVWVSGFATHLYGRSVANRVSWSGSNLPRGMCRKSHRRGLSPLRMGLSRTYKPRTYKIVPVSHQL